MERNSGKIFGVILGYLFARFEGAIAGFLVGAFLDEYVLSFSSEKKQARNQSDSWNNSAGDFHKSLLALSAAVMQSDGSTTRLELDYVRAFFVRQFGVEKTKEDLLVLREMLKRRVPLEKVCLPLRLNMAYQGRLQLLHYLFGVAFADSRISNDERNVLNRISILLGISPLDLRSIAAMFIKGSNISGGAAYDILGINRDATDEDVKRAYRRMALENHPDKVTHLGEDVSKAAEEKFKKIQEAYEEIKLNRGFS
ncbi:MAG: DnaJ domain-containing protein [Bacteroidia bacterium]